MNKKRKFGEIYTPPSRPFAKNYKGRDVFKKSDTPPDHTELKRQGNLWFSRQQYIMANNKFTEAIAIAPEEAQGVLYSNRSAGYAHMRDFKDALADGQRAVELKPQWPKAHSRVATALFGLKRLPEAAAEKKQEGNIYFKNEQYKEAITAFSEGIAMDANSHILYSNRSAAYLNLRNYQLALADAKKALQIAPSFTKAYIRACTACLAIGFYKEAQELITSGLDLVEDPEKLRNRLEEIAPAKEQGMKQLVELFGSELAQGTDGKRVQTSQVLSDVKKVLIYFSANWCAPCRKFTPILTEVYEAWKRNDKQIEVIFVSDDGNEDAMNRHITEASMPWLHLPFSSTSLNRSLDQRFGITGIQGRPALIVLNANGTLVSKDGRKRVTQYRESAANYW